MHEQLRCVELRLAVGEHPLDRLEVGDRLAERLAVLRVADRELERAAPQTERHRRDRDAPPIEDAHRVVEALVDVAQALRVGDAHVLEGQLDGVAGATAVLLELLARAEAGRALIDDERGDAALRRHVLVGARQHHAEAADRALRDEHLGAVEDPVIAVAHAGGLHRRAVGTRTRLGERPRREPLAGGRLRQVLLLLRVVAEGEDVAGTEAVVAGDGERERSVDARALLDADRVRERVHAGAAVLLRDADPEQPELGEPGDDLRREAFLRVPAAGVGPHLALAEVAHALAQDAVLLVELEVHSRSSG